jgi:hypothetical protein
LVSFANDEMGRPDTTSYANGNLTTFTGNTMSYSASNTRLTCDGSRTIAYAGAGRVITLGSNTLTWDCFNNLIAHGSDSYCYDADNLRIEKIESGDTTYYIRNGLQELAEYGTDNELLAEYIYGNGQS